MGPQTHRVCRWFRPSESYTSDHCLLSFPGNSDHRCRFLFCARAWPPLPYLSRQRQHCDTAAFCPVNPPGFHTTGLPLQNRLRSAGPDIAPLTGRQRSGAYHHSSVEVKMVPMVLSPVFDSGCMESPVPRQAASTLHPDTFFYKSILQNQWPALLFQSHGHTSCFL